MGGERLRCGLISILERKEDWNRYTRAAAMYSDYLAVARVARVCMDSLFVYFRFVVGSGRFHIFKQTKKRADA